MQSGLDGQAPGAECRPGKRNCACAFARGGPGRAVDFSDAAALLLTAPGERTEFLWLHSSLASAASVRWLREHTTLSDSFFETHDGSSTRLEVTDEDQADRPRRSGTRLKNSGRPFSCPAAAR